MRKNKLIVAVALLAASTAAKAQFTNTTATAAKATQTQVQGWGSVYVQWNPVTIAIDKKGEDDISANAFTIGYNKAFGIAKGTPLFVEAGIGLSYMFKTNEEPYEDLDEVGDYDWQVSGDKYSMLSAKVPVSLAYCWSLPNSSVDLIPFVGVDFRINLVGKLKSSLSWAASSTETRRRNTRTCTKCRPTRTCSTRTTWATRTSHGRDSRWDGTWASTHGSTRG